MTSTALGGTYLSYASIYIYIYINYTVILILFIVGNNCWHAWLFSIGFSSLETVYTLFKVTCLLYYIFMHYYLYFIHFCYIFMTLPALFIHLQCNLITFSLLNFLNIWTVVNYMVKSPAFGTLLWYCFSLICKLQTINMLM